MPQGLSNVKAIAAGWGHILALKEDGTVVAWGNDQYKQTTVPEGLNNIKTIVFILPHKTNRERAYRQKKK